MPQNCRTPVLQPADARRQAWRGRISVPGDLAPGRYPVAFTARRGQRTVAVTVTLEVRAHPLEEVQFVLTD